MGLGRVKTLALGAHVDTLGKTGTTRLPRLLEPLPCGNQRRQLWRPTMTLDQVKHVLRELGWREDGGGKVDVFLDYGSGGWTTGVSTRLAGKGRSGSSPPRSYQSRACCPTRGA